jgi:PAS domain S-box-containing protein
MSKVGLGSQDSLIQWQAGFETLAAYFHGGIFVCSATGQVIFANASFCEITGQTLTELNQYSFSDLFPVHPLLPTRQDEASAIRAHLRDRAGRLHEIKLETRRLPDGCLLGMIDTQDLQIASQAAQASLDHAPFAIFRLDEDARIVEANDDACRGLGYTPQELIGLSLFEIDPNFSLEI